MKKVSFLFAMIFAVSFAMAQNAQVTTSGSSNQVNIDQINGNNYAQVDQILNGSDEPENNKATIWQGNGDGNDAFITQQGARGSQVTITQHNNAVKNMAVVTMPHKWSSGKAMIDQWGEKNEAYVTDFNKGLVDVDQKGWKNYAKVRGANGTNLDQKAFVEQDGDKNYVDLGQWKGDVLADVYQKGFKNEAIINQQGDNSKVYAEQRGDKNMFSLTQDGTDRTFDSYVNLKQMDGSYAEIDQTGGGTGLDLKGVGSNQGFQKDGWLKLTQTGEDQLLRINQTGGAATVDMSGMNNTVQVVQN